MENRKGKVYKNKEGRVYKPWVIPARRIGIAIIIIIAITCGIAYGVSHSHKATSNENNSDANVNDTIIENTESQNTEQQKSDQQSSGQNEDVNKDTSEPTSPKETIKGYVNTFGGYTSLFATNGGNVTTQASNFGQNGLNIEIYIENDDDKIIEAFENGEIQFFAMTVNKMSMVSKQLEDKGIETVMPFFLDTSTGGDGIVADSNVKNITDLKDVKIGMAKDSVSTAIPVWFLNQSGLSEAEVQEIVDNFVLFDSTQEAVEAYVNGEVNAVSTWDMTSALAKEDSNILFSTDYGEYLVIDGIVFKKEFAESHRDDITSMIDAIITTVNDVNNGVNTSEYYEYIRQSVPDFSDYSDEDIANEISYAKFLGFNGNLQAFDVANDIYKDFCKIWGQLGFQTDDTYALISKDYISAIESKWDGKESQKVSSIASNAEEYVDKEALLSQYAKILFNGDVADFKTGYEQTDKELIDEFIKVAKVLNKTVIRISGHVNLGEGSAVWDETTQSYKIAEGFSSSEFAYTLSLMRAETVKEYMVSQGIPSERIIIEGLGGDYPIDTNDTPEGQENNRSCEISFYQAGY